MTASDAQECSVWNVTIHDYSGDPDWSGARDDLDLMSVFIDEDIQDIHTARRPRAGHAPAAPSKGA
jgi:hypothetical protein